MVALDFPDSPTNGQVFGNWTFDGTKWVLSSNLPSNGVVAQAEVSSVICSTGTTTVVTLPLTAAQFKVGRVYKVSFGLRACSISAKSVTTQGLSLNVGLLLGGVSQSDYWVSGDGSSYAAGSLRHFVFNGTGVAPTFVMQVTPYNYATGPTVFSPGILVEDITMAGSASGTDGQWTPFTPTWANLTVGDAVQTFMKRYVGKSLEIYGSIVLGSTSVMGADPQIVLPDGRTVLTGVGPNLMPVGEVLFGGASIHGGVTRVVESATALRMVFGYISGTNVIYAAPGATSPFSWVAGNSIRLSAQIPIN